MNLGIPYVSPKFTAQNKVLSTIDYQLLNLFFGKSNCQDLTFNNNFVT